MLMVPTAEKTMKISPNMSLGSIFKFLHIHRKTFCKENAMVTMT